MRKDSAIENYIASATDCYGKEPFEDITNETAPPKYKTTPEAQKDTQMKSELARWGISEQGILI